MAADILMCCLISCPLCSITVFNEEISQCWNMNTPTGAGAKTQRGKTIKGDRFIRSLLLRGLLTRSSVRVISALCF